MLLCGDAKKVISRESVSYSCVSRYADPWTQSINVNCDNNKHCTDTRRGWDVRGCFSWGWETLEGVEPSKYPGPNWGSAQAPALQAITVTTRAPYAAGRVESAAAPPYQSPPLSCLSPLTAGKAHSSQHVLEMCLVTWNIHFLASSLAGCRFI